MTSFAKKSFDVAGYLSRRPTYPPLVYDRIYAYHAHAGQGHFDEALDVGCGPGFVALEISKKFQNVTAIDPAAKMVDIGLQSNGAKEIAYKVGHAEDLAAAGVEDNSLDLVVAGQAAHWFDYGRVWEEFTRVVRPGGTVAFIGYAEPVFPHHPQLNKLMTAYSSQELGPYWQPGRKVVENLLDAVPFPVTPIPAEPGDLGLTTPSDRIDEPKLSDAESDFSAWAPSSAVRLKRDDSGNQWLMRRTFDHEQLEGYMRTWSGLHAYLEANPDDAAKKGQGKDGDVLDRFLARIREELQAEGPRGGETPGKVEFGWPLVLMMIKKKL